MDTSPLIFTCWMGFEVDSPLCTEYENNSRYKYVIVILMWLCSFLDDILPHVLLFSVTESICKSDWQREVPAPSLSVDR
jgi:hypothetical protein